MHDITHDNMDALVVYHENQLIGYEIFRGQENGESSFIRGNYNQE